MEEKETKIEEKPIETSAVKFDERRKEFTHTTTEERKTELGMLSTKAEMVYTEEGIKKVVSSLNAKRKNLLDSISLLNERTGPTPEMTPEIMELEERLRLLGLINYKKKQDEKMLKKDQEDLNAKSEELKDVEKDLREIKFAIGTRMNFE